MHNPDTTGSAIRFTRPWVAEGNRKDIVEELQSHVKKLPSSSQWHRFKQKVMAARELEDIREFLSERPEKASSRTRWCFPFRKKHFNEFLIETFLDRLEGAKSLRDILGHPYFGLKIGPLSDEISRDFSKIKLLVLKQALIRFIDQVILLKEGISFSVIMEGTKGRVEVRL